MRKWIILFLCIKLVAKKGLSAVKIDDGFVRYPNGVDVKPAEFDSVPFGTVYNRNAPNFIRNNDQSDPILDIKLPVDTHEREAADTNRDANFPILKPMPNQIYASPVDIYKFKQKFDTSDERKQSNVTVKKPLWFHFTKQHEENISPDSLREKWLAASKPRLNRRNRMGDSRTHKKVMKRNEERGDMVPGSFDTFSSRAHAEGIKWTTCDEFARGALFDPKDIIDLEWMPFYIWSLRISPLFAVVHTFIIPTKKTVQYYKEEYGKFLSSKIDWNEPKLLYKEGKAGREMLFIAADRRGKFHAIPNTQLPSSIKSKKNMELPHLTVRLKIEDPYLAMMFCEEYYAMIMAELNKEPLTIEEKKKEAETIGFAGIGGPVRRNLEDEKMVEEEIVKAEREREESKVIHVKQNIFDLRSRDW